MKPKITLTNPTDDELNAAVEEYVLGHVKTAGGNFFTRPGVRGFWQAKPYATSADAVLPLLESYYIETDWVGGPIRHHSDRMDCGHCWRVRIPGACEEVEDKSLPRAICIALLRANGVEVVT